MVLSDDDEEGILLLVLAVLSIVSLDDEGEWDGEKLGVVVAIISSAVGGDALSSPRTATVTGFVEVPVNLEREG